MIPQSTTEADPVSLHLEGMRSFNAGKREEGLCLVRRAVDLAPQDPLLRFNLATLYHALRDLPAAESACREGLRLAPEHSIGNNNMGGILLEMGSVTEAEEFLRRAARKDSNYPDPLFNLGLLLCHQHRWEEAAPILERALRLNPQHPQGTMNLGAALINLGRFEEALPHAQRAASMLPQDAKAQYNLGTALHKLRRYEEALPRFSAAVTHNPKFAQAWGNLGIGLLKLRRRDEAKETLLRARELDAGIPFVWNGLGLLELAQGNYEISQSCFEKALELAPGLPEARFNIGCLALLHGDFEKGWEEYLGVRGCKENATASRFDGQFWDGTPQPQGAVILQAEQGFGDTIQFVRYAPLVKERVKEVILECPAPLVKLMKTARGVDRVIPFGNSLPKGASRIPLLNLPRLFATNEKTIPADTPYLQACSELPTTLEQALRAAQGKRKIGICWQGNLNHPEDDRRSMSRELLASIGEIPNVAIFSLQKEADSPLRDFADTARLLQELDLVISVDTSVAHLAGALGKPVWLLLAFVPEWRWMRDREGSPWYPTMRIFRQKTLGDWPGVLADVKRSLQP